VRKKVVDKTKLSNQPGTPKLLLWQEEEIFEHVQSVQGMGNSDLKSMIV